MVTVPIACQSEGALEVYVEPVLPQPQLVAIGRSPAVDALAALAAALGWRTVVVDDGGDGRARTRRRAACSRRSTSPTPAWASASFVVVATQGHYDEEALGAALATPAAYVGLVASRKRAEAVLGYLRDRGVDEERSRACTRPRASTSGTCRTRRSRWPILAELVQLRAAGELERPAVPAEAPRHEAIDPVCGMTVDVAGARYGRCTTAARTTSAPPAVSPRSRPTPAAFART